MDSVTPQPPLKLLDQLRERIRYRHYSLRTEQAYVHWVKRFIFFHDKKHPKEMGKTEVESFLSFLANEGLVLGFSSIGGVTRSTFRGCAAAPYLRAESATGSQTGSDCGLHCETRYASPYQPPLNAIIDINQP
jgi:hypothetical protein